MTPIDSARRIYLDDYLDLSQVEVVDWMPVTALVPQPGREEAVYGALRGAHPHLTLFRRDSVPERFHYRTHPRIPPLVLLADDGWTITSRDRARRLPPPKGGTHGYDPALPSMGALFIAAGPDIMPGTRLSPIENVHVYELLAHLLRVTPAPNDGTLAPFAPIIRSGTTAR
jgi:predicted AlkP superfamily pyrophosphatase or phosphodiesterase